MASSINMHGMKKQSRTHNPFPLQLEAFGHEVSDKARAFGGKCMIKTLRGDTISLSIKDGLPHMEMRKPAEHDWKTLPPVIMTSDCP